MRTRLTDLGVNRLRAPKSGRLEVWDAALPAFGLRLTAAGGRSWIVGLRKPGARHSRIKIGEHPAMPLAEARARAREVLADPGALEPPPPAERSDFAHLAGRFLAHGRRKRGAPLRPATAREYRRALMVYALPLHERPLAAVTRRDVAGLIAAVARGRGEVTAQRTRAALGRFWSWAIANGLAEHSPVLGTESYGTPKRSRTMTDGELAAIWTATEGPGDFGLIVRLCLWTGARRSEIGSMRWSDLEAGVLTIPGERVKNHRALVLPLPRQALAALAARPRVVGRDHVFGRGPNGFQAWSKSKERLDARLGFAKSWDLHDLRRSVQTRLAGLGINRDLVNRLLNHAMGPIDEAYDHHTYMPEKSAALQRWAEALEQVAGAGPAVVALRQAG